MASTVIGSDVRTFQARFRLEGRDPHLLPDLSAAVDLEVSTEGPVPAVPRAAVRYRKSIPYVVRIANDGARRETEVALGGFDDLYVEVKSGLGVGDRVLAQ